MRKKVFGRKLKRERDTRRALFRSLVSALLENQSIKTTKAKAKAVQPMVDKLINTAKKGTQASERRVYSLLGNDKKATKNLLKAAKAFDKRDSGYTRIIKLGTRRGDRAEMVRFEFVDEMKKEKSKKKSKKTKSKKESKGKKKSKKKKESKKK